jgi:hypothetical protein
MTKHRRLNYGLRTYPAGKTQGAKIHVGTSLHIPPTATFEDMRNAIQEAGATAIADLEHEMHACDRANPECDEYLRHWVDDDDE